VLPDGVPARFSSLIEGPAGIGVSVESDALTAAPVGGVPLAVAVLATRPASTSAWLSG
jgi:hypothetical protein